MARTIALLVVAAIVVIAFAWTFMRPVTAPDESRRVRHPAGFSIVAPPDWGVELQYAKRGQPTPSIWAVPKKAEGRAGGLYAFKFQTKPDIPTTGKRPMKEGQFQGKPAWVYEDEDMKAKKLWARSYIFERDGTWYQVILNRPASESIMSDAWTEYVESFRVEQPLLTATQPATLPVPTSLPTFDPTMMPTE